MPYIEVKLSIMLPAASLCCYLDKCNFFQNVYLILGFFSNINSGLTWSFRWWQRNTWIVWNGKGCGTLPRVHISSLIMALPQYKVNIHSLKKKFGFHQNHECNKKLWCLDSSWQIPHSGPKSRDRNFKTDGKKNVRHLPLTLLEGQWLLLVLNQQTKLFSFYLGKMPD